MLAKISSYFLSCHIFGAIVGELLALCSAVFAVLYLIQHRLLKKKRVTSLLRRVPAIDVLEKVLFFTLGVGFLFLTIAIVSGTSFLFDHQYEERRELILKLLWALAVWCWYLTALVGRTIFHLSTKNLSRMSVWGMVLLAFTYFGYIFSQ